MLLYFERSEFLFATSQKKDLCVCSTNLGLSGEKKLCVCSTNLGFSVGYVLCTRYVCTWYQPAEIYTYVRYVPPVDARLTTVTSISCRSL